MTKFTLISDLHGRLPPDIRETDILLLAGDICPNFIGYSDKKKEAKLQFEWWMTVFRPWLDRQSVKKVVTTWGNHDILAFEGSYFPLSYMNFELRYRNYVYGELTDFHVLSDAGIAIDGIKIWGTPWSLTFGGNWVFNKTEKELENIYNKIPSNTDIILSHGPPYGFGDKCPSIWGDYLENVGSKSLLKRIDEIKPKLVVCGHIHEGYGIHIKEEIPIINASLLDGNYNLVNEPITWEI